MNVNKLKVLVLLSEHPDPPNSGTRVKNFHLWKNFYQHPQVEIKILYTANQKSCPNFSKNDEQNFPFDKMTIFKKGSRYLLYSHHQYKYSTLLKNRVNELIKTWAPDIIHAEELKMAKYLDDVSTAKTVTVHNVESDLLRKSGSLPLKFMQPVINFIHYLTLKAFEKRVVNSFDKVFTYSDVDSKRYAQLYPRGRFVTTRNGVNAKDITPIDISNKKNILFIGSLHYAPNAEGIRWFLRHVLPHINQDISIVVAGAGAPGELKKELISNHISFVDTPDELTSLYNEATLTIVPLLSGSGTRTKILESLAYQRPVISTSKGAEGLEFNESMGVYIFDDPLLFAKKINEITSLDSIELENQKCQKARQYIIDQYDWSALAKKYVYEWTRL